MIKHHLVHQACTPSRSSLHLCIAHFLRPQLRAAFATEACTLILCTACWRRSIRPFQVPHQQTTRLKSNRWQQHWGRKSTTSASTLKHMWNSPGCLGCFQKELAKHPCSPRLATGGHQLCFFIDPSQSRKQRGKHPRDLGGCRTKSSKLVYNGDTKWKPCSQRSNHSNSAKEQLCKRSRQYGTEIGSGFWCT